MKFAPTELTGEERQLQADVRAFLAAELPPGSYDRALGMGAGKDKEFSKKLAARGWLGMALPKQYGGHDRTAVDRFIVVEELLSHGSPVGYHWVADRQTGSIINRFGTEEQRERFLPPICRGELGFSIGMSEPDSGSDLASVSTRATRADNGWLLNGTKVWTSGAHENDWFVVLCRSAPLEALWEQAPGVEPVPRGSGVAGVGDKRHSILRWESRLQRGRHDRCLRSGRVGARRVGYGLGAEHLGAGL